MKSVSTLVESEATMEGHMITMVLFWEEIQILYDAFRGPWATEATDSNDFSIGFGGLLCHEKLNTVMKLTHLRPKSTETPGPAESPRCHVIWRMASGLVFRKRFFARTSVRLRIIFTVHCP